MTSIAVIGAGITGVNTAYALAKRGFSVSPFQKAPLFGGRDTVCQ